MAFERLLSEADVLIGHMVEDGYSASYIDQIESGIDWIRENGERYDSYESVCLAREAETESTSAKNRLRTTYGLLKRFDLEGAFPDRRHRKPLTGRDAYHRLSPAFKEVVDRFRSSASSRGLKEKTIADQSSCVSTFLLSMQEGGLTTLGEVTEDDVLAYFTDDAGRPAYSGALTGIVARALSSDLGDLSADAARVASYVPRARDCRKNIQYLRPEEIEAIRAAIDHEGTPLGPLERAIGTLLLHTGLRASDIADLSLADIDWDRDEIGVTQRKTGQPLRLPLTAAVGNALYDYMVRERPECEDPHVFLSASEPHHPITASVVSHAANRIYDAAGIRQGEGDRRGTHLFRHNAATTMVSSGTPRAVASAVLGHQDPKSLDAYLSADVASLRRCALDVSSFPVREGVFDV